MAHEIRVETGTCEHERIRLFVSGEALWIEQVGEGEKPKRICGGLDGREIVLDQDSVVRRIDSGDALDPYGLCDDEGFNAIGTGAHMG
jgi:hypothetical protein